MSNQIRAIAGRDLAGYFRSPVAYAAGALFLLLSGYFFYTFTTFYHSISLQDAQTRRLAGDLTLTSGVVRPMLENLSFVTMMVIPFLTMGLFSEERRNRSLEHLLTWPVTARQVVLGKFAAVILFYCALLAPTLLYIIWLGAVAGPDPGPVVSGYAGLLLMACSYSAIGLLISALTEKPLVAALGTFAAILLVWAIGWTSMISGSGIARIVRDFSFQHRSAGFFNGTIGLGDTLFFLVVTLMALLTADQFVNSRRWRG